MIDEYHRPRVLVRRRVLLDEFLQFPSQFRRGFAAVLEHDEGHRLEQAFVVGGAGDPALQNGRVPLEHRFHIGGPHRLAGHFEHLVGPARVPEVAVVVEHEFVVGIDPLATEGLFGRFVFVPVAGCDAVPLDRQRADFSCGQVNAVVIDDPRLKAGDDLPRAAHSGPPRSIGDKNVQDLCRADAVEDSRPNRSRQRRKRCRADLRPAETLIRTLCRLVRLAFSASGSRSCVD